jgi:hypothetical protein
MEHQPFSENQNHPTCDGCQTPMSMAPRKCALPGPEFFGHQIFECPECGKSLVVSFLDKK